MPAKQNAVNKMAAHWTGVQLDVNRFTAGTQQKVTGMLHMLAEDLAAKVAQYNLEGVSSESAKRQRTEQLIKDLDQIVAKRIASSDAKLTKELRNVAETMHEAAVKSINDLLEVNIAQVTLTKNELKALADDDTIMGAPAADWWKRQTQITQHAFASQIRMGVLAGETNDQITQRLRGKPTGKTISVELSNGKTRRVQEYANGVLQGTVSEVQSLVRTSVQSVSNATLMESYKENDDLVLGVFAVTTLDNRTTKICMARTGGAWDLEGNPLPQSTIQVPFPGEPPWHFGCRTILAPVLKTMEQMIEEVTGKKAKVLEEVPPRVRATMDGPVLADSIQSFDDFLEMKGDDWAREKLGPGRFDLWKAGKLTTSQLINAQGRELTIDELRANIGLPPTEPATAAPESAVAATGFMALGGGREESVAAWKKGFTPEQKASFERWQFGKSAEIRQFDRDGSYHPNLDDMLRQDLVNLNEILAKAPMSKSESIHRGLSGLSAEEIQKQFAAGSSFEVEALSSFAEEKDLAEDFSSKVRTRGANKDSVTISVPQDDEFRGPVISEKEKEVAIGKGIRFEVVEIKEAGKNVNGGKHFEVAMKPVQQFFRAPTGIKVEFVSEETNPESAKKFNDQVRRMALHMPDPLTPELQAFDDKLANAKTVKEVLEVAKTGSEITKTITFEDSVNLESARIIALEAERVGKAFPTYKAKVGFSYRNFGDTTDAVSMIAGRGKDSGIKISSRFTDPEKFATVLRYAEQKRDVAVGSIDGVIAHEMGHVLDMAGEEAYLKNFREHVLANLPQKKGDLSDYALSSRTEAVAEAFSSAMLKPVAVMSKWEKEAATVLLKDIQEAGGVLPPNLRTLANDILKDGGDLPQQLRNQVQPATSKQEIKPAPAVVAPIVVDDGWKARINQENRKEFERDLERARESLKSYEDAKKRGDTVVDARFFESQLAGARIRAQSLEAVVEPKAIDRGNGVKTGKWFSDYVDGKAGTGENSLDANMVERLPSGITLEQAKERLEVEAKRIVKESAQFIRLSDATLSKVLTSGEMKTVLSTGKTTSKAVRGQEYIDARLEGEARLFGIPLDAGPQERPIYGYLETDPDGAVDAKRSISKEDRWSLDVYGTTAVKLKPSVKERSSFMHGDSLDRTNRGTGATVLPEPMAKPSYRALGMGMDRVLTGGDTELTSMMSYTETQIFGGVKVSDIDEVVFAKKPPATLVKVLQKKGIPFRVVTEEQAEKNALREKISDARFSVSMAQKDIEVGWDKDDPVKVEQMKQKLKGRQIELEALEAQLRALEVL